MISIYHSTKIQLELNFLRDKYFCTATASKSSGFRFSAESRLDDQSPCLNRKHNPTKYRWTTWRTMNNHNEQNETKCTEREKNSTPLILLHFFMKTFSAVSGMPCKIYLILIETIAYYAWFCRITYIHITTQMSTLWSWWMKVAGPKYVLFLLRFPFFFIPS